MKVVIVHGKNTNPNEKWYPWLKKKVEEKNYECIAPILPNSDDPEIISWLNEIKKANPDGNHFNRTFSRRSCNFKMA